jgi:two-component system sensor histidine kinase KdpD
MAAPPARPGSLRIYLGAAPGVGKTYAMLNEGRRRRDRGSDVVIGMAVTHLRAKTADQIGDLEVVPRRRMTHEGAEFEEMDLDAVLARRPEVTLVDELAHTNVPGSRNEKRWQDVDELLAAGIDVISTVNIQHLESLNDVVERITGVRQRETIPDHVVRRAEQVELVDMTPEALRRRMAHGNIYKPDRIDAALGNYFRVGNLGALRELALLWVADRVDDALEEYRERHGITETWELRERVIVAVTGAPGTEHLIRRAARIAQRSHGELIGVHITADSGLSTRVGELVAAQRRLLEVLGGEFREVVASDIAVALIDVARAENATQIVLGASRRSRLQRLTQGSVISRVVARAGPIDVHVISAESTEEERLALPLGRRVLTPVSPTRQAWGWGLAAVGLPLMTLALANVRDDVHLPTVLLLYLGLGMTVALVGGALPALATVVGGFLLSDYYFTVPLYDLSISSAEVVISLVVYLLAAGLVAVLVDRLGRTRLQAARSHAEAEAMAALAGSLAEADALPHLLAHLRATFGMRNAALFRADGTDGPSRHWVVEASVGSPTPSGPDEADVSRDIGPDLVLTLSGRPMQAADEGVLTALAGQLATAVEAQRLQEQAGQASELAAANDLRVALLQAVSHDLRTPLAGIKASISSLRQREITWPPEQEAEFLRTIEEETDRLDNLVENLLDMSRLQSGAVRTQLVPVTVDGVVLTALAGLGPRADEVIVEVGEDLPPVVADRALLERVVANLVDNALKMAPAGTPVRVEAGTVPEGVDIRVVDQGPGIASREREQVFEPFQRTTDHGSGVGLGLAIARGFLDAMGGEILLEDTPGGGLSAVVRLRRAEPPGRAVAPTPLGAVG